MIYFHFDVDKSFDNERMQFPVLISRLGKE